MRRSPVFIGCTVLLGLQILTAGEGLGAEELARLFDPAYPLMPIEELRELVERLARLEGNR